MFHEDIAPCVPCGLLAEGFSEEDGHRDLEVVAVWSGTYSQSQATRHRCRECGVVWLHDETSGWRIHDPDGLLEGFIPTDRAGRGRPARA